MDGDDDDEQMKEEEEQGDRHKSSSWRECGESPSTSLSSSTTHSSLHITPGHQNSGTCSDTISSGGSPSAVQKSGPINCGICQRVGVSKYLAFLFIIFDVVLTTSGVKEPEER